MKHPTSMNQNSKFPTTFAALQALLTICSFIFAGNLTVAAEPGDILTQLQAKLADLKPANPDLLADVGIFHKGIVWALRYDTPLTPNDELLVTRALATGLQRAEALAANKTYWTTQKGKVLRGFVSAVDGSRIHQGRTAACASGIGIAHARLRGLRRKCRRRTGNRSYW